MTNGRLTLELAYIYQFALLVGYGVMHTIAWPYAFSEGFSSQSSLEIVACVKNRMFYIVCHCVKGTNLPTSNLHGMPFKSKIVRINLFFTVAAFFFSLNSWRLSQIEH